MVPCGKGNPAATDQDSRVADVVNPRDVAPDEQTPTESKQISPSDVPLIKQPCYAVVLFTESRGDGPNGQPGGTQPQSDQGGSNSFTTPEKLLPTSAKLIHGFPQGQEGGTGTPPTKGEKPSEDGFNWRKYGQKNVRGNEFVRSYYKCTHPNCGVKKQVERSLEGLITDTVYFGQHDHPKPQTNAPLALCVVERKPSSIATEEKSLDGSGQTGELVKAVEAAPLQVVTVEDDVKCVASPRSRVREGISNDDDPASKKKKKDNRSVDVASPDKPSGEARHIVQTTSEVDIVNDGYRWRKYGQKLVKGNPHPRSYYRCSSPGCPVKKHVERAHHDPKLVMTSYEGQHDHDVPAAVRTVIRNPLGSGSNDDARIKSEEHEPKEEEKASAAVIPVTRIPLGSGLNGDARIKSEEHEPKEEEKAAAPSDSGQETRSSDAARIGPVGNEKQQSVLNAAAVQS